MSNAIAAKGITITFNGTNIAEMKDLSGPGLEPSEIEVTNHGSGGYEETISGIKKWKPVKFEVNFVPSDASHLALLNALKADTVGAVVINWPDGQGGVSGSWGGSGRVMSFMPKGPVDKALTADLEIKPTGVWDFEL
jgi:predicted secreted protein